MQTIYDWRPNIEDIGGRKRENFPDIVDDDFWCLYDIGKKYSMVHVTGFYNVWSSIKYIHENQIEGDFVECGVWLGGVSIFAALTLSFLGDRTRRVHMYDTFAGFPVGSVDSKRGVEVKGPSYKNFREAVERNIVDSGADKDRVSIVEGPVEKTLTETLPKSIAIARLDTDHYSSTKAEMEFLYPIRSPLGVLIVDDYGEYDGSRKAVDEYLKAHASSIMLASVDRGVRSAIKTS